ncbi:hypothetical protein chiPu_0032602, partial [Chiloscyllium punctatum]|nr:hypothetical protein [Chiloscyllium punctatum]
FQLPNVESVNILKDDVSLPPGLGCTLCALFCWRLPG